MTNFDGYDDILDSREIIERIEELETFATDDSGEIDTEIFNDYEAVEYAALISLRDAADSLPDWEYGVTLIHENYFTAAMKDDVIECGYLPNGLPRWIADNIDWEGVADALKADYTDFEFRGATYWARA